MKWVSLCVLVGIVVGVGVPVARAIPMPQPFNMFFWFADGTPVPRGAPFIARNLETVWEVRGTIGWGSYDNFAGVGGTGDNGDRYYTACASGDLWGYCQGVFPIPKNYSDPSCDFYGRPYLDVYLTIRFGDLDGDGETTLAELAAVQAEYLSPGRRPDVLPVVDYNADGLVDAFEYNKTVAAVAARPPGDADGDGDVDLDDFTVLKLTFGQTPLIDGRADFDDDGDVDLDDFVILKYNFGYHWVRGFGGEAPVTDGDVE